MSILSTSVGAGKLLVYRYGAIGDTLTLTAFLASMRPVCETITLLGPAERMRLIDASLWDRILSFDLVERECMRLAGEHDLAVAFRGESLPGFTHALPPLPPAGVSVYGWMKEQAMLLGGADRDLVIPACRGRGTLLAPGSGSAAKNAPLEQFLEIAAVFEKATFVLGPAESEEMDARIRDAGYAVERPGDLGGLERLVVAHAIFHGNDSGLMHLAALRGLETHVHIRLEYSRDWIPPGRVIVHEAAAGHDMAKDG